MPHHATRGSYKKGHPPSKPKGAVSKFTTLKQAFLNAFQRIGGEDALVEFYKSKNPSDRRALLQMLANMLPKDVILSGNPDAPLNIKGIIEYANSQPDGNKGRSAEVPGSVENKS